MDTRILILIVVAAVVLLIVAGTLIFRQRTSKHLKQQFGPEYDRTVAQHGDARRAEAVLINREKRVEKFSLRALPPADRLRYAEEWDTIQRRFVDDPSTAVNQADSLVNLVMAARGYPVGEAEERAADISVNYPTVVENYRAARHIFLRHARGESSTEDLRRAMVYFHSLFDELLGTHRGSMAEATRERLAS